MRKVRSYQIVADYGQLSLKPGNICDECVVRLVTPLILFQFPQLIDEVVAVAL